MRIAFIVSTFPPYRGGTGNAAADQARLLASQGFSVRVFTPAYTLSPGQEERDGYVIERLQTKWRWGNAAMMSVPKATLNSFDALFVHYPFFGGVETLLSFDVRTPIILYYHMDALGKSWYRVVFGLHRLLFLDKLVKRSSAVLVSSLDYAEHSFLPVKKLKDENKLFAVPFSVNASRFIPGPKSQELLTRHRLSSDVPIVLFVGAMDEAHYFKGVPTLLKSWSEVVSRLPKAVLLLVGDGAKRAAYQEMAEQFQISNNVRFVGAASDAELPQYFRVADLFVFSSTDRSEAFGLVALEAMASGKAVIASNLPGVASLVRHGQTGLLVQPKNETALSQAICNLLESKDKLKKFGEAGRSVALSEYSEQAVVAKLSTVFRSLVRP